MKTALVTITIGDYYNKIAEITHPSLKAYADKVGADFIVWKDQGSHAYPHYRKLDIGKLLKEYDRVLYVDTDIMIRPDSPDLFKLVPANEIAMFNEGAFAERAQNMIRYLISFNVDPSRWNGRYYNSGVILVSKQHHLLFTQPPEEGDNFYEQTWLNLQLCLLQPKMHDLDYVYNFMTICAERTGEERHSAYFVHYAGLNQAMKPDDFLGMLKYDAEVWVKAAPKYEFPRNICINVEGGMGDQFCAEPVIRHIRDVMFPGSFIIVRTDFPDLFGHLGLPVYHYDDKSFPQKMYLQMFTMRYPEHPSWSSMAHTVCHGVDFASLQTLRGTLPVLSRTPKHNVALENFVHAHELCGKKMDDLVVLHPGRGWPSKTFPKDVWQSWIDALVGAGYRVAVIGKRISKEQGVVEGLDLSKCLDLIDKLSTKDTFALLANAPVLISNDSAPIHMAGAFENWIGVIATCKHPDHILPYRNGSVRTKTRALEEKGLYDDLNRNPDTTGARGMTIAGEGIDIRPYLPNADKILAFVKEVLPLTKPKAMRIVELPKQGS